MESTKKLRRPVFAPAEWVSCICAVPQAQAVSSFVVNTLLRGRRQKLMFFLIAGVGFALVIENSVYLALSGIYRPRELSGAIRSAVLSLPLTLSFFAMVALRRVFRMPADLPANWLFRFHESRNARPAQLNAVLTTFLMLCGAVPLILSVPVEWVMFGAQAIVAIACQAALILTLAQYSFHLRGKRSPKATGSFAHAALCGTVHLLFYRSSLDRFRLGSMAPAAHVSSRGYTYFCLLLQAADSGVGQRTAGFRRDAARRTGKPQSIYSLGLTASEATCFSWSFSLLISSV